MAADVSTLGVLTEQGDLGLGFEPISKQEEQIVKENDQIQKDEKAE